MPTLIAIGYRDETTAAAAGAEARGMAGDLGLEPDAIAVISRNRDGGYQVDTNHHAVSGGAAWGMYWAGLFGALFFAPASGTAVEPRGLDPQIRAQVRDLPQPGTSALFLVVDSGTTDAAVEGLRRFGGTVLRSRLGTEPASAGRPSC